MTGPLPIVLAAVLGGSALYCAGRLVLAPLRQRVTDRPADLLHLVMGTVMAAALLGVLNRRWDLLWVLGFLAAALWFLRAAVVAGRSGLRSARGLQHGAGCLAMVLMLVGGGTSYAAGPASGLGRMPGMAKLAGPLAPAGGSAVLGGGLLVLTLGVGLLALAAVELRALVPVRTGPGTAATQSLTQSRPMLAPRCATGCRVAMGVSMGLALLSML
jgi:Domain of unknown function (DUF5134)